MTDLLDQFYRLQKKSAAYRHAMDLLYYDGNTVAPPDTAENRAITIGVLTEEMYHLTTCDDTISLLEKLETEQEALSDKEKRMLEILSKDMKDMQKIPMDEYVSYQELLVKSENVWHTAKENSDFEMFRPYLESIFDTAKRFAGYLNPKIDAYDYWLNEYENGLNTIICDDFFGKLKDRIVPLLNKIKTVPQVSDEIRYGCFPEPQQEKLSYYIMDKMGLNLGHVGVGTTEHPFTTSLGSHLDERITTHYYTNDFISSMYSVIHEGGHALYDTGSDTEYIFTVLDGGVSMGIHESQSRFYENIIGRSREYCNFIYPKLVELFPEHFAKYTEEDLYKAVNKVEPSLIRTEADEVTYSLHVMVRYEIEKAVMAGNLSVKDIPDKWNALYKEYFGIDVPDNKNGCLQDSHWAGGAIGYFPSYAFGSAYGAQFLYQISQSVDIKKCVRQGNMKEINEWNRENIWRYGCLYKPGELLQKILKGPFEPDYYLNYLENKYKEIYGL